MKKLFISPHDDDNVLFGAFTCLREKPTVLVVLDSYIQPNRGEQGCDAATRAQETTRANEFLGCEVQRLFIPDDLVTEEDIEQGLSMYFKNCDVVYAPALQGGNPHHDMVHRAAVKVFGDKVIFYTTYTRTELWTTGNIEVMPTTEELALKNHALECYQSQLRLPSTQPHFDAVLGKSEWLL